MTIVSPNLTTVDYEPLDLDLSELRKHVAEMHQRPGRATPRSNTALASQHATWHHHYASALGHAHLEGMIEVRVHKLRVRKDQGMWTGKGAMTRAELKERLLKIHEERKAARDAAR